MIRVRMIGHAHRYPVSDILRQFFGPVTDDGGDTIEAGTGEPGPNMRIESRVEAGPDGCRRVTTILEPDEAGAGGRPAPICESEMVSPGQLKREIKRQLYRILSVSAGIAFPWGSLTGIRPTLVARECLARSGGNRAEAQALLTTRFDVHPGKASLAVETAEREDEIQARVAPDHCCVYVGIPFCPGRCAYCSFTQSDCETRIGLASAYVDALLAEARAVFARVGRPVACVYFGGGTPTSLSAGLFEHMLAGVLDALPLLPGAEITVEAGRPDTIDALKLSAMRRCGVGRVCVNPQTMHDETLRRIGRRHTAEQAVRAVCLARESGIPILNTDLIAGLPGETPEMFEQSLRQVLEWSPSNVTVHTLSVKRKSRMTGEVEKEGWAKAGIGSVRLPDTAAGNMLDTARAGLAAAGMHPYYLYRQKDSVGGLENTGFAAPGTECVYNVCMMGDRHSVIGLGSGSMTKRVVGTRVDRIPSVRDIQQYIGRSEEMADRIIRAFEAPCPDGAKERTS
ncbi:MAG: coproporphyrinogen dehydrogenase HemZ [Clostridia bacterium]|nr:coproporphyrinogen dehydrogenase HemZ [Clostridia bacterium]